MYSVFQPPLYFVNVKLEWGSEYQNLFGIQIVEKRLDAIWSSFQMPLEYRIAQPFEYQTNGCHLVSNVLLESKLQNVGVQMFPVFRSPLDYNCDMDFQAVPKPRLLTVNGIVSCPRNILSSNTWSPSRLIQSWNWRQISRSKKVKHSGNDQIYLQYSAWNWVNLR